MVKWLKEKYWLWIKKQYLKRWDLETFEYFVSQSKNYPYWWRNFNWWGAEFYNTENPIYSHRWHGEEGKGLGSELTPEKLDNFIRQGINTAKKPDMMIKDGKEIKL